MEMPWWAILHQSQNQCFPQPRIQLKEFGLECPLSIAGHLQLEPADTRGELTLVAPVAVA